MRLLVRGAGEWCCFCVWGMWCPRAWLAGCWEPPAYGGPQPLTASWIGKFPGVFASVALGAVGASQLTPDAEATHWSVWVALVVGIAASIVAPLYVGVLARRGLTDRDPDERADQTAGRRSAQPDAIGLR